MGGLRLALHAALVAAAGCGLPVASAAAPDQDDAFFHASPGLQFIEQRLPPAATVVIPPDPALGKHVATDAELGAALAHALEDFLAPPSTFASTARELISEVCRYRPAQAPQCIAIATDALLKYPLATTDRDLDTAMAAAIAADPRSAGLVVRHAIRRLALLMNTGRIERDAGARTAGGMVLTAVAAVPDPAAIQDILQQALEEAMTVPAFDLEIATISAVVHGARRIEGVRPNDLAKLVFVKYGRNRLQAAILCAGIIQGAGPEASVAIKDEAALNLPVPTAAYLNIVCSAYVAVQAAPQTAALQISRFLTLTNADYVPAALIGGIVAAPQAAAEILQAGLNRDLVLHGRSSTREIVEAAVMVREPAAPELAAAAVGHGDLQKGNAPAQIAEGVARSAPSARLGVALAAQLKVQERSVAAIKSSVAGAVAGAVAAEKSRALGPIAFAAAAAEPDFAGDVLDQLMISAPRDRQYACVLGVLAACPGQAAALLDRALHHRELVPEQARPIAAGGAVVIAIATEPGGFFRAAQRRLAVAYHATPAEVEAVVLGASLANPRGFPAVAAAAVAAANTPLESLVATAIQNDPGATARVAQAAESALRVRENPGDLFQTVRQQVAATPSLAPEVVTGAMAAAPALGHVIGHAAVLAAPGAVAQIVPHLFAFSSVDSAETFVALTTGVIDGLSAAGLEPAAESDAIEEGVAACVRSVVALSRAHAVDAGFPSEGKAITAVVAAASQAAPGRTLEIAQVAARAARALSGSAADQEMLARAVCAGQPQADAAKVAEAIRAGFAEADLQMPAREAKALLDYAHDSLTGRPMTSFHDL
jgi:hypothetical protein